MSQQGFQIKMAEQDMHASSPSTVGKATHGALLVLSPFNPSSTARLRGSLLLLHGTSSLASISAQDSIYYSPLQSGRLFLGPALTGVQGGSDGKVSAYNSGDLGSILGSGRSLGEGNGNPLQYSCLENPMDGGAWQVAKSQTRLSDFSFSLSFSLTVLSPAGDVLTT